MTISGQFKDYNNNTIYLTIFSSSGPADLYTIDDTLYDDPQRPTYGKFCFDGKAPIKITRSCSDLFTPIISASCKIKLRSNIWCGDLLYSQGIGDIIVKVERSLNGSNNKEILFVGYVQPLSFSQDINMNNNIIDIKCCDILGYLKDKKLSTGSSYNTALGNAHYRTIRDILKTMQIFDDTRPVFVFPGSGNSYNTRLYADDNIVDKINLKISDNLWLGEGKDDEMDFEAILLELLKYTNSRIISENGLNFYLIDNQNVMTVNDFYDVNLEESADLPPVVTDELPDDDISGEQVTIDDCYNSISVKCDLETVDDAVTSPLEEKLLTSPYINQQLMMREYMCDMTQSDENYYRNFCRLVIDNNFSRINISRAKIRDWYFRYLDNSEWHYNNNMMNSRYLPNMPFIDNGDQSPTKGSYIWQSRLLHDLGYKHTTDSSKTIYRPYNDIGGAYFISVGHTKEYTKDDNSPNGAVDTTNYLVIPVKGLYRGTTAANEAEALNEYEDLLEPYKNNPMITYTSSSSLNLTPSDKQTTNYLVINGKLRCMPVYQSAYTNGLVNGLYLGYQTKYEYVVDDLEDELEAQEIAVPTNAQMAKGPNGTRSYYQRYFDIRTPNQEVDFNSINEPPNVSSSDTMLLTPPMDNSSLNQFQYRYNMISTISGSYYDNITHMPILCCRLYIENESGYRRYVDQDPDTWAFSWTEWTQSSDATFAISINPKIDDYIIGPEHEITNTVTAQMNLKSNGLAIPITYEDDIHGKLHFEILGPYNAQYDDVNKRTHSKWTQFWKGEEPEVWTSTPRSLLDRISNIWISQFKIIVDTDNAKNATLNSGDLLYYSEDNLIFNNPKDGIEFKITTALTSEQAAALNIATGISFNNPITATGALYTTDDTDEARPERKYIDTMYRLYSQPKKIIEYSAAYNDLKISDLYRSIYNCELMQHLDIQSFKTIVLGDELDLKKNRIKLKIREITEAYEPEE